MPVAPALWWHVRLEIEMRFTIVAPLAALVLLAGCATRPETHVTRFHLDQAIAPGHLTVEPLDPADRNGLEFQTYASIVGAELARLGFTEAPGLSASEQVATLSVERGTREGIGQRSGFTLGLGGGSYGYRGGVGGGVTIPLGGGARGNSLTVTRMMVQIKRRSDNRVIWEGKAETVARAGASEAEPSAAVHRLASAMFQGFPGRNGETITVK